jgi:hypothetical protein
MIRLATIRIGLWDALALAGAVMTFVGIATCFEATLFGTLAIAAGEWGPSLTAWIRGGGPTKE